MDILKTEKLLLLTIKNIECIERIAEKQKYIGKDIPLFEVKPERGFINENK